MGQRLKPEQITEISELWLKDWTIKRIVKETGVSKNTVSLIVAGDLTADDAMQPRQKAGLADMSYGKVRQILDGLGDNGSGDLGPELKPEHLEKLLSIPRHNGLRTVGPRLIEL